MRRPMPAGSRDSTCSTSSTSRRPRPLPTPTRSASSIARAPGATTNRSRPWSTTWEAAPSTSRSSSSRAGSFRAIATDGDVYLGGKDWDAKLVAIAAERFRQERGSDPRDDPASLQDLTLAAEAAKKTLSERARATLVVNHQGQRFKVEVTREQFEEATAALLERTRVTTEIVVLQAGLTWPEIDRVLLVGGSTRMPMVVRMLQTLTGKTPDGSLAVDEAVAHGAALFAGLLLQKQKPGQPRPSFAVTNVSSTAWAWSRSTPRPGGGRTGS